MKHPTLVLVPLVLAIAIAVLAVDARSRAGAKPRVASVTAPEPPTPKPRGPRLHITNACSYDVWIQQEGMPAGTPAVTRLRPKGTVAFTPPSEGLAKTRYWPKSGCDATGQNCSIGQSSPPCSAPDGCAPKVDSALDVYWGCTLAHHELCARTPKGLPLTDTTWTTSLVGGFTFPFTVLIDGGDGRASCGLVNCAGLALHDCPAGEDLGWHGKYQDYRSENLNVTSATRESRGCFSPCAKLDSAGWGGHGLKKPTSAIEAPYCSPSAVPATDYSALVSHACRGTEIGARSCSADAAIVWTIGPGCP